MSKWNPTREELIKFKYNTFARECLINIEENKKYFDEKDIKTIKLIDSLISKVLTNELTAIQKEYEESVK